MNGEFLAAVSSLNFAFGKAFLARSRRTGVLSGHKNSLLKAPAHLLTRKPEGVLLCMQRQMFALLTLVQRCNTGIRGATGNLIETSLQLKLESKHSSNDLSICKTLHT